MEESNVLVILERIEGQLRSFEVSVEGKLNRMDDRVKLTEERVSALLNVVTGASTGGREGLVVRVHSLETHQEKTNEALEELTNGRLDAIEEKLDAVLKMQTENPPILYLLRFQTRKTVIWLLIIFALLSLWWVSGFRQPILEFLGLPLF